MENKPLVFITGGTGLIGKQLTMALVNAGYKVRILSRKDPILAADNFFKGLNPKASNEDRMNVRFIQGDILSSISAEHVSGCKVIINLAGTPIFDRAWTTSYKESIKRSRIEGTRNLVAALLKLPTSKQPEKFISASAIGYYGTSWQKSFTESSPPGVDYLSDVTKKWEREVEPLKTHDKIKATTIRIGIVLDQNGGMLGKLLTPFKLGLGGKLGSGQQWISWIHHADLVQIFMHVIQNPSQQQVYNACSPNPVSNKAFSDSLAKALGRPAFLPVPAFVLRAMLGERAQYLTTGQKVIPKNLQAEHFDFRFSKIDDALEDILGPN